MTQKIRIAANQDERFIPFATREACAQSLAERVISVLKGAIAERGKAMLVVSGGSTPVPLFQALNASDVDWQKVTILVADERWVSVSDNDSNEKLVRDNMPKAAASILSLAPQDADETVQQGALRLSKELQPFHADAFDMVILGMGDDGHTASLFPHHPDLMAGLASDAADCLPVTDSPKPPSERVTLSARRLIHTHHLVLHITGESKRNIYEEAEAGEDIAALPIRYFLLNSHITPTIYWAS